MCGIAGVIASGPIDEVVLHSMRTSLRHRGPDADGIFVDKTGTVGLCHTRLSILDLSDSANQPFHSDDGRFSMVYNGEVYNFRELRKQLVEGHGVSFRTSGDTEVILKAFETWGNTFVTRLNGMFVIGIVDHVEYSLTLYRDRLGIKPLYYCCEGDTFLFASELKALRHWPSFKNKAHSKESLHAFLHLGYIPEPLSVYEGIRKFPAGHMGIWKRNEFQLEPYWEIRRQIESETHVDFSSAKATLHELLRAAVNRRLVSDVPLGTFLSGGIDSSLITALATEQGGKGLKTFSIGFEENQFDESEYALKVAQHLGTDHHPFTLKEKDCLPLVDEILNTYDEPFADSSSIPMMLVSRLAKKEVSVILTGDGGDEQFQGYGAYKWATRLAGLQRWKRLFPIIQVALRAGNSRWKRVSHLFETRGAVNLESHIFSQEQYYFSQSELKHLVKGYDASHAFGYEGPALARTLPPEENQALFDLQYYLKDDLLVKVDRSSMKYGLECRVPFLDHEVLAFTLNLDIKLKAMGTTKRLLKEVLYEYVPKAYFDRPKWGFGAPLHKWLLGDLRYLLEDYLNERALREVGDFDQEYVQQLLRRFEKGEHYLFNRVWLLILWQRWRIEMT